MSWVQAILDFIRQFWPFYIVEQYERAGYYICGRYWKEMGPGLKVVCPYFTEIKTLACVPAIVGTPRLDITTKDRQLVSFAVSAVVRVANVPKALNEIDDFRETTQELLAAEVADLIAKADPERLAPESRGRLLSTLVKRVNEQTMEFGVETTKIRFTSFVTGIRTYRLLNDSGTIAQW